MALPIPSPIKRKRRQKAGARPIWWQHNMRGPGLGCHQIYDAIIAYVKTLGPDAERP